VRKHLAQDAPIKRVEAKLDKLSATLTNQPARATYAQVARTPTHTPHTSGSPREGPGAGRSIRVKFTEQAEAQAVKALPASSIIAALQNRADVAPAVRSVIAAKQLPRGDIILHTDSNEATRSLQSNTKWTSSLGTSAKVHKQAFPVLVHGVSTAPLLRCTGEEQSRLIERENSRLHPGLKIQRVAWLRNPEHYKKTATSIIIETDSAEQANRLISEGVIAQFELKATELYDPNSRIRQCFNCQRYGHITNSCKHETRCGFCGGKHETRVCTTKEKTTNPKCAACTQGSHYSWSRQCPERQRERARAQGVYTNRRTYYPTPLAAPQTQAKQVIGEKRPRPDTLDTEWQTVQRKPGRPRKFEQARAGEGQDIARLLAQGSMVGAGDTPVSTQSTTYSELDTSMLDLTQPNPPQPTPETQPSPLT